MKDETYFFHQTPEKLAKVLIQEVGIGYDESVLEPFKGEGAFYNHLPEDCQKDWCEIEEGRDYRDHQTPVDWVISNPPFRLETGTKRVNSFYFLLEHFSEKVNKGLAFLGNDSCFSTLTPKRIKGLESKGLYLHKIVVCSIKKWRGRYFFIIFKKQPANVFKYIEGSF
jgi:hypothetical protein